ncbi:hypothetical protein AWH56_011725 [Anaerobacillus isosaccharinicus]|uniref:Uncharacterized protein n=1 Tax=Anaerobacillus isosaccharinicus TaxID=1532552 RepID=A0A1S2LVX7_9BACI|nr:hypothetical protein [Anaerobacillus isosaccharinicus]MBA5588433.1 hypothetical protein [Anaerobacillus isosaccharinicus]QOY38139.1 hypothetical protein AWH56_011725 [Anaerobacillus isosaccharinicus]
MKNKLIVVILSLSLLFNAALFYMFIQKSSESEHRLNVLYMAYEEGLYPNTHLINAMNGFGKEHLLNAYADLHSASRFFWYFKPQVGIRSDDNVITFYSDLLLEWLAQDYEATEEEYKNMIDDM